MKKWPVLLLFLAFMLVCGAAMADFPTNPYYQSTLNLYYNPAAPLTPRADMSAEVTLVSGGTSIDDPATWSVSVTGGVAPYTYEFVLGTEPEPDSPTPNLWSSNQHRLPSSDATFTASFLIPQTYLVFAYVTDARGVRITAFSSLLTFTPDAAHPSLNERVARLAAQCPAGSDYERIKWVHDYVITHCVYDSSLRYHGADSILVLGTGVCDSYSKLMVALLNELGIPAGRVTGGNHAWVIARLDGSWSMFDPTWDDCDDGLTNDDYWFFGLSTEGILLSGHTIADYDPGFKHACTTLDNHYFVRSGQVAPLWMAYDGWETGHNVKADVEAGLADPSLCWTIPAPEYIPITQDSNAAYYGNGSRGMIACLLLAREIRVTDWTDMDGYPLPLDARYRPEDHTFDVSIDLSRLPCLTLPDGLTALAPEAFADDPSLRYAVLPASVLSLGESAFRGCPHLAAVYIPDAVVLPDSNPFAGDPYVTVLCTPDGSVSQWAVRLGLKVWDAE